MKRTEKEIILKKREIFIVLPILAILLLVTILSGCTSEDVTTGSIVKELICNASYFEYKEGECCLDKNANSICDTNESIVEEVTATEETKTETISEPEPEPGVKEVKITVDDACADTTYFECLASYITKNEVFFKLKARKEGYIHPKKISVLDCEKTFADKDKASQGYAANSELVVLVPCTKNSLGQEIKDKDYIIEYIFYPASGIDSSTGEWKLEYQRGLQISTGKISGTVRSEPKII